MELQDTIVPTNERDTIFKDLQSVKENTLCFDCNSKNPKWASVHLGIFICFECSGRHRSYGTHISFVRSIDLDKWKYLQIYKMTEGGNKNAKLRFEELEIEKENRIYNYDSSNILKYKEELNNIVKNKYFNQVKPNNNIKKNSNNNLIKEKDNQNIIEKKTKNNKADTNEQEIANSKVINFDDDNSNNTPNINKKTNKKTVKKASKIEKVDNFDFDWDDDVNFVCNNDNNLKSNKVKKSNKNKVKDYDGSDDEDNNYNNKKYKSNKYEFTDNNNNEDTFAESKKVIAKTNLENRKAICSDDFAEEGHDDIDSKKRKNVLSNMKGAQAISSADLNGEKEEEYSKLL